MSWLINATQLDKFRKNQKTVVILDATWYSSTEAKNAYDEYLQRHIPGARFIDLSHFFDPGTSLPNMLTRDVSKISELIGALGITNEHKVIFYDNSPAHTSYRAWWMFKVFGHNPLQLYVLDGGYREWEGYGGRSEEGASPRYAPKTYQAHIDTRFVRTLADMKQNLHSPREQVVDVRHPVRYAGGPESRSNLRQGHIPGSFCFPYFTMFETNGYWKSQDKIRKQLTGIGVDLDKPIVATCGSGITAPILSFALELLDQAMVTAVYDGSWSEWGADALYEGETSLAERPVVTSLIAK